MRVITVITPLLLASCVGCLPDEDALVDQALSPSSSAAAGSDQQTAAETPPAGETSESSTAPSSEPSPTPTQPDSAAKTAEPASAPDAKSTPSGGEAPPAAPADTSPPKPAEKPATERVKADVGVAKKGRSLDEFDSGIQGAIAGPAKAYFGVREKVVFQIQIPDAMNKYRALNGNYPKSHEEFMTQIIQANSIQLPDLNPGCRYVYDPEKGELMVERQRQ